jgi:antitoxin component YwqK of YwqJK toxin-antitoxin module
MKNLFLVISLIFVSQSYLTQQVDTLIVYQNDTTQFRAFYAANHYHKKGELTVHYRLKNPQDSTYYFIYNDKGQLMEQGLYTANYFIDGESYRGFLNSTYYHYHNRRWMIVYYKEEGRTVHKEYYKKGKLKPTKIFWF